MSDGSHDYFSAAENVAVETRGCTIEATLPTPSELNEISEVLASGSQIYLSAPPGRSHADLFEAAAHVKSAGFDPVPHIAARSFENEKQLAEFIARLRGEADVQSALVIAGDKPVPAGIFVGALDIIDTGLLQKHGICRLGISGYPEGHPKIDDQTILEALRAKIKSAQQQNLSVHVVSQFCFDANHIANWINSLRVHEIDVPIRFGVAGPANTSGLLKHALRCGVRASFSVALSGRACKMLNEVTSDSLIHDVLSRTRLFGCHQVYPHIYSFGGLTRTVVWASSIGLLRCE